MSTSLWYGSFLFDSYELVGLLKLWLFSWLCVLSPFDRDAKAQVSKGLPRRTDSKCVARWVRSEFGLERWPLIVGRELVLPLSVFHCFEDWSRLLFEANLAAEQGLGRQMVSLVTVCYRDFVDFWPLTEMFKEHVKSVDLFVVVATVKPWGCDECVTCTCLLWCKDNLLLAFSFCGFSTAF